VKPATPAGTVIWPVLSIEVTSLLERHIAVVTAYSVVAVRQKLNANVCCRVRVYLLSVHVERQASPSSGAYVLLTLENRRVRQCVIFDGAACSLRRPTFNVNFIAFTNRSLRPLPSR